MAIIVTSMVVASKSMQVAVRCRLFRRRDTQVASATIIDGQLRLFPPRVVSFAENLGSRAPSQLRCASASGERRYPFPSPAIDTAAGWLRCDWTPSEEMLPTRYSQGF